MQERRVISRMTGAKAMGKLAHLVAMAMLSTFSCACLIQAEVAQAQAALTPEDRLERGTSLLVREGSQTWNAQTIRNIDIETLLLAVAVLDYDRPEYSRRILPQGMTLEQFDRMLNREISRRDAWPQIYASAARGAAGLPHVDSSAERQAVDFIRPSFSYPEGLSAETTQVRLNPTVAAIYDSALDTIIDNQPGFAYRADTARAVGRPPRPNGLAYGIAPNTDVADNRLMYAFGSQSAFNPSNPNAELSAPVKIQNSLENIQSTYCSLVPNLYQAGRSKQPREAGLFGLLAARVDARNAFELREVSFGITGPC